MVTAELRDIIGSDAVDVPADRPDAARQRHATHTEAVAEVVADRVGYAAAALTGIVVLAFLAIITGSVLALIGALLVLVVTLGLLVRLVYGLTAEVEHPSPELAALLESEGVGDPDRLFNDLVVEFRPVPAAADGRPAAG